MKEEAHKYLNIETDKNDGQVMKCVEQDEIDLGMRRAYKDRKGEISLVRKPRDGRRKQQASEEGNFPTEPALGVEEKLSMAGP